MPDISAKAQVVLARVPSGPPGSTTRELWDGLDKPTPWAPAYTQDEVRAHLRRLERGGLVQRVDGSRPIRWYRSP